MPSTTPPPAPYRLFRWKGFWPLVVFLLAAVGGAFLWSRAGRSDGKLFLTPEERRWLSEHGPTLVVAPTPDYPPVEFFDAKGQPAGFAGDYLRLLEEKLQCTFHVKQLSSWSEVVRQGRERQIDMTLCCQRTPEREAFWNFTTPFLQMPTVMVLNRRIKGEPSMEDLAGLRLGAVETFASYLYFKRRHPGLNIQPVSSDLEGLRRANRGELDVFFSERPIALHLIQKHDLDNLRVGPEAGFTYQFSSASRSDYPILNRILQKAQNAVTDDEWHDLSQRWFTSVSQLHAFDWRRFAGIAALGGMAVALILAWNVALRRQVRQRTRDLETELQERRRIETDLIREETHLRITLDALGEGVVTTDQEGHVTRLNPAAEKITGMSAKDALGRLVHEVCPWLSSPADFQPRGLERAGRLDPKEHVVRIPAPSEGREMILAQSAAVLRDHQGHELGVVFVFREITPIIHLEEQLRHTQKMEAIGHLAGGVAHDFNNILTGILGGCDLMERHLASGSDALRLMSTIRNGALQAASLIKRLLAFARKAPQVFIPVDLHGVIQAVADLLRRSLDRHITVVCRLDAKEAWVMGDPGLFQSALMNLGINARDAMPEGGILRFQTSLAFLDAEALAGYPETPGPGTYLAVCISDTGIGIPPSELGKIFDPFYTTKPEGRGTGLGLAAVYRTVREHRGALNVESVEGHGTAFTLFFPTVPAPAIAEDGTDPGLVRGRGHILVVDDEPLIRQCAQEALEAAGFEVITAQDGEEGWRIFQRERSRLDAVLLDMVMPGMGGSALCRRIHTHAPHMKVVLTSGFDQTGSIDELLHEAAWAFLQKPFRTQELVAVMNQAVIEQDAAHPPL